MDRDHQRLLKYWDRLPNNRRHGIDADFVLAAGDLQIDRRDILDVLVDFVIRDAFGLFKSRLLTRNDNVPSPAK
jgi:hypothetical protein